MRTISILSVSVTVCCCCASHNYTQDEYASVSWNYIRSTDTKYLERIQRQSVSVAVQKIVRPFWTSLVSVLQIVMLETPPYFLLHIKIVHRIGT